jgi:hypothetical protein
MRRKGAVPVIILDQLVCMDILFWLPSVIAVWISLPFDEILQVAFSALETVIDDHLYFIFILTSDQVRWQSDEVRAV